MTHATEKSHMKQKLKEEQRRRAKT